MKTGFYVGSPAMAIDMRRECPVYVKATVEEAVEEARKRLAHDPKLQELTIVAIKFVVRRTTPPIEVVPIELA